MIESIAAESLLLALDGALGEPFAAIAPRRSGGPTQWDERLDVQPNLMAQIAEAQALYERAISIDPSAAPISVMLEAPLLTSVSS